MRTSGPRYTEAQAREAVAASLSYSDALRRLGMRPAGGNHKTIRRYVEEVWRIPIDHFDPAAARSAPLRRSPAPLESLLVVGSRCHRGQLKERLFAAGLKERRCELCGQGEIWHGRRMALILDHVNAVHDDNRLENLRLVCPNCNATLDTHCGRRNRMPQGERECLRCGALFHPRSARHRYCSRECGQRAPRGGVPQPARRQVARPPYEQLVREIGELGYAAVGRRYGVSDNAIRKWRRAYERDGVPAPSVDAREPSSLTAPTRREVRGNARTTTPWV